MPRVRMFTLYAGPAGVIPPGGVGTVDEGTATALVTGGFAERIDTVRPAAAAGPEPDEALASAEETAEAPAAPETAATTGRRKRGKPAPPAAAAGPEPDEAD